MGIIAFLAVVIILFVLTIAVVFLKKNISGTKIILIGIAILIYGIYLTNNLDDGLLKYLLPLAGVIISFIGLFAGEKGQ